MKKSFLWMVLACFCFSCNKLKDYFPHPPKNELLPEFNKVYGGTDYDGATSIAAGLDGGYLMVGYAYSHDGDVSGHHGGIRNDGWIIKLDKNGTKVWQKALGGV